MKGINVKWILSLLVVGLISAACGPASPEAGDVTDDAVVSTDQANAVTCRPAYYCLDATTGVRRYVYFNFGTPSIQAQTTCTGFITSGLCRSTPSTCSFLGMAPVGCTPPR